MGKKVKKDEKAPPDDVFDPLLVESRQAATVVLMLTSPEEDVLAKACEAIYKFVEKCDENKKTLLDLNVLDSLLQLIQHEDRIVRRNACMAVGVIAQHAEARRMLKKREETIPAMVNLLSPEEDTVVHEFAALCLSSLANDFSSKVMIYEQDGMESLVRLLGSHDPDVQKNSIETIALMLQDYQSKAALRDLNGFPPILDLLRSEYAIIQNLALVSLQRATEDAENRAALRELEGINRLIDFIGHHEWADQHVFAVMVISNCLEDPESMEMIKENGGLQKLVAFIMDTQPPEEEEKKGKEKKGASRAGKNKKGGDDDDKHKGKGGDADQVTPTLPEVKEHAARAIARAAKNADNRKILHEQEVEKMLIFLLTHDDPNVQVAAAHGLGVMSENLTSREAIGQWDGMEPLIKMIKNDNPDVREAASMALANLTTSNTANCQEILKMKGIEPMIDLLSDSRELVIANAACVLTNMASDEGLRSEIQRLGVITALIDPLKSSCTVVQSKAALATAAFVSDVDSRTVFRENGGIKPLVSLLHSGNDDVRRSASWATSVCAVDEPTAVEMIKHGGLEILQQIKLSGTRKNAFSDIAMDKLLDSNLSAKYALTGYLGPNNLISDGFFDIGQLRPDDHFLSLEDYCNQEVNQKRPIILINAKPEKPSSPVPQTSDYDITEKTSKASVTGRSSRVGRGTFQEHVETVTAMNRVIRKSRAQKEREEKQKEEEQTGQQDGAAMEIQPFTPPGDPTLMKYMEEVKDRIQPLPTTRDQVVALAQYVAEKMGGPIDRGQVANFSWELPISQLKFDLKSNVIPIGMIKAGIHYHRALLFKALADTIAVNCSLVRGEYNRSWNEVMLTDDDETPGAPKFPLKTYLVDLIHQPGRLLQEDSIDAINYQRL